MKIQTLYAVSLAAFAEVTEAFTAGEYPLTFLKCEFARNFLEGLGYKGALKMPAVAELAKMAGGLGIYDAETEEVDLKLLFMGLDGTIKKLDKLPAMGITFTKKDLELWAKRVREADKKAAASKTEREEEAEEDDE